MDIGQWWRIRRAARALSDERDRTGVISMSGYERALRYIDTGRVQDFVQEETHGRWRRLGGWR
jgi:hypothetical protein